MADDPTRVVRTLSGLKAIGEQGRLLEPHHLGDNFPDPDKGLFLESVAAGAALVVSTANSRYLLRHLGDGWAEISGHPQYCPDPVRVNLHGTDWMGRRIKECYLAPGMRLEFSDRQGHSVMTSAIRKIERV